MEELLRIEVIRPVANQVRRGPVQMNENESVSTGNDYILPVDEKNLFVGKHPQEKGKAGGATDIIQRPARIYFVLP